MLKNIPACISPDLLKVLCEMGHGDEILISDAHYPACSKGIPVLRADGIPADKLIKAIMKLIVLDQYVDKPVIMMSPVPGDTADESLNAAYRDAVDNAPIEFLPRMDFYDRAQNVYCIVVSGELRKYGNIILKKGVVPVSE